MATLDIIVKPKLKFSLKKCGDIVPYAITPEERAKLAGIEENANNYTHPYTHPSSILNVVDVVDGAANKFLNERGEMVAVAHESLTDKNSEAAFQHIDTTVTKPALDAADMVAVKDSVTGKMVLTPKSNFPTVDEVNLALATKADKNDTLSNTADIRLLENVINSANINQETTATVSGVDTVLLPKTAANTGMKVQLFGASDETKNVFGTGRIRSVNSAGLAPSYLYFNGGQLRSNGLTKDEIRKGTNGYELVKIVGVGTLGGEIINQSNILGQFVTLNAGILGTTITTTGTGGGRRLSFLNKSKWYKITLNYTADANWEIRQFGTGNLIGLAPTLTAGTNVNLVAFIQSPDGGIYFRNAFSGRVITINSMSIKEVSAQDAIANDSTFYEQANGNVLYKLATSTTTAIPHAGLLNSNRNGTAYFEPIIADAGVYGSNLSVQLTDYPIASFESIRKYANGTYTELNTSTAVIASGGLSFTHPDLVSGDLVMFTYAYSKESIGRSMTLTHYDSRFVVKDTANANVYRITPKITNGVLTWTLTLV